MRSPEPCETPRPTAAGLLSVWDRGRSRSWPQRADLLLAAARPEMDASQRADMSIGRRDRVLLELRRELFGDRLDMLADCPDCREPLELALSAASFLDAAPAPRTETGVIEADSLRVAWRAPNVGDLLAIAAAPNVATARAALLQRCVVAADDAAIGPIPSASLPAALAETLAQTLAAADPDARVELAMTCPVCARPFAVLFDIVRHLWSEIEEQARVLIREVHRLALAYGWSERAILAMSPQRRQAYLELVP